nr:unnamed protein product [Digitaria exilis]CAB3483671.1 unnamed protein product [Digitaria exilis]
MEATVLSVGKSVLDAALGYAKSTIAEEVALQLGVHRDHAFVRDELEMMRAFLMAAHDERQDSKVFKTWVKQVRDVAYDVEDCLQDFTVHLDNASLPQKLWERRRIAKKMKELRLKVEDVSHRNRRYQLLKDHTTSSSRPSSSITAATIFGVDEARCVANQDRSRADLVHLISNSKEEDDLGVIAVWGTNGGDLGQASIIRAAYENVDVKRRFPCRAWARVVDPFNPREFVQGLVKHYKLGVGVDALLELATDKALEDLAAEFSRYANDNSYLIVITNLSTIEEWDLVKICFPNNKKGSRIIVSTTQIEVARLCAGQEVQVSELSQLSADQTLYAFYEKVPKGIGKLKGLQTMGLVNLARGKKILHDIKRLTLLRKLSLTGISRKNARELCSTIANLSCLESLLLRAEGHIGLLGCLNGISSPPENLQSLKLYGTLGELPPWIRSDKLKNLVKLSLRSTRIFGFNASDTIDVLGRLPNLAILRLRLESFLGHDLHFTFHGDQAFPSLKVMEFDRPQGLQEMRFEEGAMPNLELLDFCAWYQEARVGLLTGLECLTRLKEFTLSGSDYDDDFMEDLRAQLARNPNQPNFKRTARHIAPGPSQSADKS